MAISTTVTETSLEGRNRVVYGLITFDSSYPTGGEAFTKSNIGLTKLKWLDFNQGEDGRVFHYDYSAEKILVYESGTASAALDEEDASTDLSGVVVEFRAVGI